MRGANRGMQFTNHWFMLNNFLVITLTLCKPLTLISPSKFALNVLLGTKVIEIVSFPLLEMSKRLQEKTRQVDSSPMHETQSKSTNLKEMGTSPSWYYVQVQDRGFENVGTKFVDVFLGSVLGFQRFIAWQENQPRVRHCRRQPRTTNNKT